VEGLYEQSTGKKIDYKNNLSQSRSVRNDLYNIEKVSFDNNPDGIKVKLEWR